MLSINMMRGRTRPLSTLHRSALCAVLLFGATSLPLTTHAAFENLNVTIEQKTVPTAGITPNSFFYIVDTISERISLWMTRDAEKKITKLLALSQEKLQEAEELAAEDKKGTEVAMERYERYIADAVKAATKAQENNQQVDALLQRISAATLEDLSALISLATTQSSVEGTVSSVIDAIGEQQQQIIAQIQDEQKQKETIELVVQFVQDAQASIPPEQQEKIRTALNAFLNTIIGALLEKGDALLDSLSDTVKEYARQQANRQLDTLKTEIIRSIQRIHF